MPPRRRLNILGDEDYIPPSVFKQREKRDDDDRLVQLPPPSSTTTTTKTSSTATKSHIPTPTPTPSPLTTINITNIDQIPPSQWKCGYSRGLLCFRAHHVEAKNGLLIPTKVAAFDLDGTLIKPKQGRAFPINEYDWEWLYPSVPIRLKELRNQGWDIVIFSNQSKIGIGTQHNDDIATTLRRKLDQMMDKLGFKVSVYISCGHDRFRKPSRGMFDFMLDDYYSKFKVLASSLSLSSIHHHNKQEQEQQQRQLEQQLLDKLPSLIHSDSFYTGDACGRLGLNNDHGNNNNNNNNNNGMMKKDKDHSSCDYLFAMNAWGYQQPPHKRDYIQFPGQRFYTPEGFFQSELPYTRFRYSSQDVTHPYQFTFQTSYAFEKTELYQYLLKNKDKSQLILLVGPPSSGKTTFFHQLSSILTSNPSFQGSKEIYWVNQDTLGTLNKCLEETRVGLNQQKIVIVDNTNVDIDTRQRYVKIARGFVGVHVHAVIFNNDEINQTLPLHLNQVRAGLSLGDRQSLPNAAFLRAKSLYAPPQKNEGFTTISNHHYLPPSLDWSQDNPYPTPPWGLTTTAQQPKGYIPYKGQHRYGDVTKSRVLQDYYYQYYEQPRQKR